MFKRILFICFALIFFMVSSVFAWQLNVYNYFEADWPDEIQCNSDALDWQHYKMQLLKNMKTNEIIAVRWCQDAESEYILIPDLFKGNTWYIVDMTTNEIIQTWKLI